MGGSGGFTPPSKPLNDLLRETSDTIEHTTYLQSVNSYLSSLLKDYNDRDSKQIQDHISKIQTILEQEHDTSIALKFGGSVSKHTYVNGLSDVDILVQLNDSKYAKMTPKEAIKEFQRSLNGKIPGAKVSSGNLAVTVTFDTGHEIQLLPAISTSTGIKIPRTKTDGWSNVIRPDKFASKLTKVNQDNRGRIVPVIKLFKGLNDYLPTGLQLSGYHIESLAISAFENYSSGKYSYHDLMQHYCKFASTAVLNPVTDRTGQSIHVDEYLGKAGSIKRRQVGMALNRLSNKMDRADVQKSVDQWKRFFDDYE